jgi:hypothetical protein
MDRMTAQRLTFTALAHVVCASLALAQPAAVSPVKSTYIETSGHVHVVHADGQDVKVPKEKDQVSTEALAIAPDRETVAWLIFVPNCCTSYPVPTTLVVYRNGKIVHRINDGMMIYKWEFQDRGKHIAISSGTVHGMTGIHLTRYDSRSGKALSTWDGEATDVPPAWGTRVAH